MLAGFTFCFVSDFRTVKADNQKVLESLATLIRNHGGVVSDGRNIKAPGITHVVIGEATELSSKRRKDIAETPSVAILSEASLIYWTNKRIKAPATPLQKIWVADEFSDFRDIPDPPAELLLAERAERSEQPRLLTDKHAPKCIADLLGNQQIVREVQDWLQTWKAKGDVGGGGALMLCGPPGIGKTTLAHLAAKTAGFTTIECDASDVRNKAALEQIFIDASKTYAFATGAGANLVSKLPHVLIMDEVDGMSSGDLGGAAALVSIIKRTKSPIICICNDKYATAARTVAGQCKMLTMRRPSDGECVRRLSEIAKAEKFTITNNMIRKIVEESMGDMRQAIVLMQVLTLRHPAVVSGGGEQSMVLGQLKMIDAAGVDHHISPFDGARKIFAPTTSLSDREALVDMAGDLLPLFVAENYLSTSKTNLQSLARAADYISLGDIFDREICARQNYSLSHLHSFISTVAPATITSGSMKDGKIEFPKSLAANSTMRKRTREANEFSAKFGVPPQDLALLRNVLCGPLLEGGGVEIAASVDRVVKYMCARGSGKDDFDELVELSSMMAAAGKQSYAKMIPANVKRALTKKFSDQIKRVQQQTELGNNDDDDNDNDKDKGGGGVQIEWVSDLDRLLGKLKKSKNS